MGNGASSQFREVACSASVWHFVHFNEATKQQVFMTLQMFVVAPLSFHTWLVSVGLRRELPGRLIWREASARKRLNNISCSRSPTQSLACSRPLSGSTELKWNPQVNTGRQKAVGCPRMGESTSIQQDQIYKPAWYAGSVQLGALTGPQTHCYLVSCEWPHLYTIENLNELFKKLRQQQMGLCQHIKPRWKTVL